MSETLTLSVGGVDVWVRQFRGLREQAPGLWPLLPRLTLLLTVIAAVILGGAWLLWMSQWDGIEQGRAEEEKLRTAFREKVRQSQNLEMLRTQKTYVVAAVAKLERQLPGKAEMDAMLSEINQAGVSRGLQFELFKPGQVRLTEHYAELPIDIRMSGSYHALAGFVSDIANLPRIVTMDHLMITRQKESLAFQAVAHTYRYLDPAESQQFLAQQSETSKQKEKGRYP
jgi:type IV pilus assembly protein PilO